MKRFSCAVTLIVAALAVMVGCSDNAIPVSGSGDRNDATASVPTAVSKRGPIVRSVTGSANTIEPSTGKSFTYTVVAHEYADGSFDGEYQLYVHGTDPFYNKLHGRVLSLKIWDGNKAVIGGVETNSGFPGWYDALVVYDNGEGKKSGSADIVAVWLYWEFDFPTAQATWNLGPDGVIQKIIELHPDLNLTPQDVLLPVQMGNIQVR